MATGVLFGPWLPPGTGPAPFAETLVAETLITEPRIAETLITEPLIAETLITEPLIAEPLIVAPLAVEPFTLASTRESTTDSAAINLANEWGVCFPATMSGWDEPQAHPGHDPSYGDGDEGDSAFVTTVALPVPPSIAPTVGQPAVIAELPRIHAVGVVDAVAAGDYFVTRNSTATLTATLGTPIAAGQAVRYSLDNGGTWQTVPSTGISNGTQLRLENLALSATQTTIDLAVFEGPNRGQPTRQSIERDTTPPVVSLTGAVLNQIAGELSLLGTGIASVLGIGESVASDVASRVNWSKLRWNVQPDDSGSVSFTLADTRYVRVASDNRLAIGLSAAKLASLSATAGFGAGDTLSVTAGFLADPAGWSATGDQLDRAGVWIFGAASQKDSQVDVRDELRLSFPENVARGTGLIQLVRADGLLEESFDAATSTALSFAGQTLTINPSRMLQGSYAYSVTIANGSLARPGGASYPGIADLSTLSFTTGVEIRDVPGATSLRDQYPGSAGSESVGNHRALYIPVTFASDNRAPESLTSMQRNDLLPTADYYRENSQGAITLNADYTPVVTLPYTHAWHQQFDSQYDGLGLIISQSTEIARRMGYDSSAYDVVVVRFSDTDLRMGASWGGGNSAWLAWGGMSVTAHEIGHALGLPHSKSTTWAGSEMEYGNQLDIMGGGWYGGNSDLILDRKVDLGWIESTGRLLDAGPGIYRLHGLDQTNRVVGQYYGLSQRLTADSLGANPLYSLEYRPSITALGNSVVLLRNQNIIDLTPATDSQTDGGIQSGQTFRVPGSNAYFTVLDVRDGFAEVAYQSGTFTNNVAPSASLSASATTVAAGATVAFTANAVDANGDALVYYWEFSDGVRGSGASYSRSFPQVAATAVTGTLTVSDMRGGTATRAITINAGSASTGTPQTVGSVTNPTLSKPRVAVVASDAFATEGGDFGGFTFTRVGTATTASLTVNFTFSGATSDVASLPSSIIIPAGQSQAVLTLSAFDDLAIEAAEQLMVTVSAASAYDISPQNNAASLTILDNDTPVVTIETVDGTAVEGSRDGGLLLIKRTGSTTAPMTVYYGLTGDAFNGGDYGRLDGQIVIPAGEAAVALSIVAVDDEVGEPDEAATIHLTSFQNAYSVGASGSASVTIRDNADPPEISLRLERGALRNEGGTQIVYLDVVGGTGQPATVSYTVGGTATAGVDYKALSGTIVVPTGGRQSIALPVQTLADSENEHAETVALSLAPAPGYVLGSFPTALVEIVEPIDMGTGGDRVHVSRFAVQTLSESNTDVRFYIHRDNNGSNRTALTVTYSLLGTASPGADYTGRLIRPDGSVAGTFTPQVSGNSLTIPANANGMVVALDLVNDTLPEGMETIALRLDSVAGGKPWYPLGIHREATYTIDDNDAHSILVGFESLATLAGEDRSFQERTLSLPVVLNQASSETVTVRFSTAGGTATGSGTDYTFLDPATGVPVMEGTLVFPPGITRQSLRVQLQADPIPEDMETLRIRLESPTRASLATFRDQHTVTLYDSVPSGIFNEERWSGTAVYNNNTWDTTPVSSLGFLTGPTTQSYVGYAYSRRLSGVFTAPVTGEYRFYVAGDDKARLYLSSNDSANGKQLIASLASWSDFQQWDKFPSQQSAPIILQAGQSYYLETQQADADGFGSASVGWRLPGASTIVPMYTTSTPATLENRYVRFVTTSSLAVEGGAAPEILVTLDRPNPLAATAVTVAIDASASSATTSDVTLPSTTITFAAGETSKRLAITANSDGAAEASETLRVRLTSATNALIIGPDTHDVRIVDANAPAIGVTNASVTRSAAAGAVVATLPITLAAGRSTAAWTILAGNSRVAGNDTAAFSLDDSGVLRLANPSALPLGSYNQRLIVSVRDNTGSGAIGEVRVAIGDGAAGGQIERPAFQAGYPDGVGPFSFQAWARTSEGTTLFIQDGESTRDTTLQLSGTARPGNVVRLYSGGFLMGETTAATDGHWRFTTPVLGEGGHLLRAEILDSAGNIGVTTPRTYHIRSRLDLDGTFLVSRTPGSTGTVSAGVSSVDAIKAIATVDQGVVAYETSFAPRFQIETWTGRSVYDTDTWESIAPVSSFSSPILVNSDNIAGANSRRIRGTFTPPSTGSYVFYIAGDDEAKLFLNPAGTAANAKQLIASVPSWTGFQQWTVHTSQKSSAFTLTAGQSYYIEANLMGLGGTDHVSVGWTGPGISTITPIAVVSDLVIADSARGTVQVATRSVSDANVGSGAPVTFGGLSPDGGKLVFGTGYPSSFGAGGTPFIDNNAIPSGPYSDLLVMDRVDNSLRLLTSGDSQGATRSRQAEFVGITSDSQFAVFTTDHIEAIGGFTAPGKALPTWPAVEGGFPTVEGKVKTTSLRSADLDPAKMVFQLSGLGVSTVASQFFEEQRFAGQTLYTNNSGWDTATPAFSTYLTSLTPAQNVANDYSRRIRGMITAPATGNYFFYVAADDAARVYLSTTESAANKTEIASVASFTGFQQWSESAPRRSAAIALQAGQRYYIEVQHREGSSGDHVSVAWKGPGISAITPIVSPSEIAGIAATVSAATIQRSATSLSFWVEAVDNGVTKAVKVVITDTDGGIRVQATEAKSLAGSQSNVNWEATGTSSTLATSVAAAGLGVGLAGVTGANLTAAMINEVGLSPARDIVAYHFASGTRTLLSHSAATGHRQSLAADVRDVTLSKDGRFVLFTAADASKLGNEGVAFTDASPAVRDWFAADLQSGRITLLSHAASSLTQSAGAALTFVGTSDLGSFAVFSVLNAAPFGFADSDAAVADLISVQMETGAARLITRESAAAASRSAAIATNAELLHGNHVYFRAADATRFGFTADGNTANQDLFRFNLATGDMQLLSRSATSATTAFHGTYATGSLVVSPNQRFVVFEANLQGSGSGFTVGVNGRAQLLLDTEASVIRILNASDAAGGTLSYTAWDGPRTRLFTPDSRAIVWESAYLGWYAVDNLTYGPGAGNQWTIAALRMDLSNGVMPIGTSQVGALLTHGPESLRQVAEGGNHGLVGVSADSRFALFRVNDASRFGDHGIAFVDAAPTATDLLAIDLSSRHISLVSGQDGVSHGGAAAFLASTAGGGILTSLANVAGVRTPAGVLSDANGGTDILATRTQLLAVASADVRSDGQVGSAFTLQTRLIPGMEASLLRDGQVVDRRTADPNGVILWPLTNVPSGTRVFRLEYPGQLIPVAMTDPFMPTSITVTVATSGSNQPPTNITLSNATLAENAGVNALVGTLLAFDPDAANTHTFALSAGIGDTDNSLFGVSGAELRALGSFDFESRTSYSIRLQATDQDGLTFEKPFSISISNVNETPVDITLSKTTVREAAGPNAVVGNFATIDPDAGGSFTYSLVAGANSADNALFNISGAQLRATGSLFAATQSSYLIRVRSTDQGGLSMEKSFTITLTPPNQPPTNIALSNDAIGENAPANRIVGTLSATDPDADNTFTYSLVDGTGATGNAQFNIAGTELRANQPFDHEAQSGYSVRIRATDQDGLAFDKVFLITVTNVNEPPTNIALSNANVAENAVANAVVGMLSATDPDAGGTFSYSLVAGAGAADNALFTIAGDSLRAVNPLNFETKSGYSVRVRTTDQGGLAFEKVFTIDVTDVNEAPTNISLSNTTIAENAGSNAVVGNLTTTDPDAGGTFTYALVAGTNDTDNLLFNLNGSQLRATGSLFAATKTSYAVRLRATDQGGLATEKAFTITLTGTTPNQAPTGLALSASTLAENAGANTVVGELSTVDPNPGNTFTYTLTTGSGAADNALFNIAGNQLRATGSLNFEAKSSYSVRVRTTDQGGLRFERALTIAVTNVNEAPSDVSLSTATIAENAGANALVGTLRALDPDANATFTYTLVAGIGGDDNSRFTIAGNRLTATESLDFETRNSFSVRVRAADQGGLPFEKPLVITVRNVNEAPQGLSLSNASIAENAGKDALVGTFAATDPDNGDSMTFRLVKGAGDSGNAQFKVQGNRLLATASLNFENKSAHSVRVQAVDRAGLAVDRVFSISVTDVNEAPRGLALSNSTVAENAGPNAVVGNLTTTDFDTGDNFTYTLVSGPGDVDNAAFNMDGNRLRASSTLDFETKNRYVVRVRTADKEGLTFERSFSVSVVNANDAPTDIKLSKTSLAENAGSNALVGTLAALDADAGSTISYALVAGDGATDNSLFKIATNQLLAVGSLDFETKSSFSIRVRATDQGQLSYEKPFVITATNVNEAPTALLLSNATIVEGAGANATVGVLSATDPDAGDTFSFSLVSGTGDTGNAAFAISGNQLRAKASLNQAAQSRYSVRVRGRDQGGLVFDQVFAITVTRAVPAFNRSVADRPEGESIDLLLSNPFAVSAPQSANASLLSLGGSRAASSHKPIADDFQPSRRLVDRQAVDRQAIDRQAIDRQAIDRQAVDRSVADVDALFALWCDKA